MLQILNIFRIFEMKRQMSKERFKVWNLLCQIISQQINDDYFRFVENVLSNLVKMIPGNLTNIFEFTPPTSFFFFFKYEVFECWEKNETKMKFATLRIFEFDLLFCLFSKLTKRIIFVFFFLYADCLPVFILCCLKRWGFIYIKIILAHWMGVTTLVWFWFGLAGRNCVRVDYNII